MALIVWLLPVLLHEAAHVLTALLTGVKVKRVGLAWLGPYVVREPGTTLQNLCITAAGPGINLMLAMAFWHAAHQFAVVNLILGVSNLLPLPMLDGGRLVRLLGVMSQKTL